MITVKSETGIGKFTGYDATAYAYTFPEYNKI